MQKETAVNATTPHQAMRKGREMAKKEWYSIRKENLTR